MQNPLKETSFSTQTRVFPRRGQVLAKRTSFLGAAGWGRLKCNCAEFPLVFLRSRLQGLAGFVVPKMTNMRAPVAHFVTPSRSARSPDRRSESRVRSRTQDLRLTPQDLHRIAKERA